MFIYHSKTHNKQVKQANYSYFVVDLPPVRKYNIICVRKRQTLENTTGTAVLRPVHPEI